MQASVSRMSRWWNWKNGLLVRAVLVLMSRCFGSMNWLSLDVAASVRSCTSVCILASVGRGHDSDKCSSKANDTFLAENPDKIQKFMKAVKRATDHVLTSPAEAYETYIDIKPEMASVVNGKIYERSYAYFSKDLKNVERDWEKVTKYGKRLGVLNESFEPNYTNQFLDWTLEGDSADPTGDQKRMLALQKDVAMKGGFQRLDLKIAA